MKNHVWIVEILINGKWRPVVDMGLTRKNAYEKMKLDWEVRVSDGACRVRKYVAEDIKRKEK